MAESDLYSIRCHHCDCTFAPETKQCVHCGGPLGGGLLTALRTACGEVGAIDEVGVEEEEAAPRTNKLWVVMAGLAMLFSMMRQCV